MGGGAAPPRSPPGLRYSRWTIPALGCIMGREWGQGLAAGGTFQWKKGPGVNNDAPAAPPPHPTPPPGPLRPPPFVGGTAATCSSRCHRTPCWEWGRGTALLRGAQICCVSTPNGDGVAHSCCAPPSGPPRGAPTEHNGIVLPTRPQLRCPPRSYRPFWGDLLLFFPISTGVEGSGKAIRAAGTHPRQLRNSGGRNESGLNSAHPGAAPLLSPSPPPPPAAHSTTGSPLPGMLSGCGCPCPVLLSPSRCHRPGCSPHADDAIQGH